MERKVYTADELNNASREELIGIIFSQQESIALMLENQELILEQIAILRQQRFGRHSEKMDEIDGQMSLFFNEPEAAADATEGPVEEPEFEEVVIRRKKKKKGKREDDLKDIPVTVVRHEMSEEELKAAFPDGKYKRLPDEVYKRLEFHPASFEVKEHHVAVYAGMDDETIVRAQRPKDLLRGSIVTPSLEAAIINGKYVNSLPLYRMEQEFKRNDVNLCRQNMANWTIQCADRYLAVMYDYLHKLLYGYQVLQADETPVEVTKDGRAAGAKSYMWIYRTGKSYAQAVVLYEYQKDRKADHPEEFLKGFQGVCVTDGYQAYHSLEEKTSGLTIAGCWAHARRKYVDALKAIGHYFVPRYTRVVDIADSKDDVNKAYSLISASKLRNEMIVNDVIACVAMKQTPVILTRFKEHAKFLYDTLKEEADHVFLLYGDNTDKENANIRVRLKQVPKNESLILVATGQKIGEGFDFPRLDVLMLAAPVSFEGRLEQYVGRLNRDYEGKEAVYVYDYIDPHVRYFNKMYAKRLRTYKKTGFSIWTGEVHSKQVINAIYDSGNYTEKFEQDVVEAEKMIVISSPDIRQDKIDRLLLLVKARQEKGVNVTVITTDPEEVTYGSADVCYELIREMQQVGINVITKVEVEERFAVIDEELVWHGGMNLLGKVDIWDNLMRIKNHKVAAELLEIAFGVISES